MKIEFEIAASCCEECGDCCTGENCPCCGK